MSSDHDAKAAFWTPLYAAFAIFVALQFVRLPVDTALGREANRDLSIAISKAHFLHKGSLAVFFDVRNGADYRRGHIRGALPWSELRDGGTYSLPMNTTVVIYGRTQDALASKLARELAISGTVVYVLAEGWEAWQQLGLPTAKGNE